MDTNFKLRLLRDEAEEFLQDFARGFKSGAKFTLLVRHPNLVGADLVVTDDDIDTACAALKALKPRDPMQAGQEGAKK